MSDNGIVRMDIDGAVAIIVFDRPAARNAMTWAMYDQLEASLGAIEQNAQVRTAVLRGAAGTFVAGTDIAQFTSFRTAEDGLKYEQRIDHIVGRLAHLRVPALAVLEGFATGAGLAIAAACDLRIATPDARFGVPIARTVGNCLSAANTARLMATLGTSSTQKLLLTGQFISAEEAARAGFLLDIVSPDHIDNRTHEICDLVSSLAPLTLRASKDTINRILDHSLISNDDLISRVYGSRDFREGVQAFLAKRPPRWTGS